MPPLSIIHNFASSPSLSSSLVKVIDYSDGTIVRLNFLSNVDCGQDTTVISVVPNDEATAAISKLNEYEGLMIKKVKPKDLCKFLVHDDRAADGQQLKFYITAGPIWHMETLFGCSTFGYITYDVESSKLVYLKDFWRINH
ncbi:hypothetical protein F5148DRAFT_1285325 [Russula earlei]|uniref:Uncharacterized protein n=1 Tax=Russula earlei TaxID=71964 RepID=A0ACC0U6L5_9AGAM|nr:hypothetical protein F5148DRAFT_1285325 [Russula earlei]